MKYLFLTLGLSLFITCSAFTQEYSTDSSTVGLWHFNEQSGTTAVDASGNAYDGVVSGTTVVGGRFDKARGFVTDGDTVSINRQPFKLAVFTVEAWVYLDTLPEGNFFIVSNLHSGVDEGFFLTVNLNKVLFTVGSGVGSDYHLFSNSSVVAKRWYHVAATYDGSVMKIFLNGVEDASAPWTQISYEAAATYPMMIGNYNLNPWDPPNPPISGRIDEVRISNRARQPNELNVPIVARGLLAYYPFIGNANDESGNGNNGVASNVNLAPDRFGIANRAFDFNGISSIVDVSSISNFTGEVHDSLTFGVWIRSAGHPGGVHAKVFEIVTSGPDEIFLNARQEGFGYVLDFVLHDHLISSPALQYDKWYFAGGTFDGATQTLYVDSLSASSASWSGTFPVSSGIRIGSDLQPGGIQHFFGEIDDLRLYSRSFSAPEVDSLYHEGGWPRGPILTVAYKDGWNLVSVPSTESDMRAESIFPSKVGGVFEYNGGYTAAETLEVGKAYWMKSVDSVDTEFFGPWTEIDTIEIQYGWNMVGGIGYDVPIDSVVQVPSGLIISDYFGFSGGTGYAVSTTIQSGKGYWVKAGQSGHLMLKNSNH